MDPPPPLLHFEDGDWPDWMVDQFKKMGFDSPTMIQAIAWGVALEGRDLIAIAATGSGKTLGFALPALIKCQENPRKGRQDGPTVVIVSPTRYPRSASAVDPRDALERKGPQRRPQKRLDRRLEEVAEAVGGGYCQLQMPLGLALGVRETVAGHRLGPLEGGRVPPSNASLVDPRPCAVTTM